MRILIVGGGEVGTSIATELVDAHEVVVVDSDEERVDTLAQTADVLAIRGDGTDLDTLENAGVEDADIAIAATDDDETNLAVCGTVTSISDTFTICQVEKATYLHTWRESHGAFGANLIVNSKRRAARAISRIIDLPMARDLETFADGAIHVGEFEIVEDSPVIDANADDLSTTDLAVVGVVRGDAVRLPDDATLQPGDQVVAIGPPDSIDGFSERIAPEESAAVENIVIFGGGTAARRVAELLESHDRAPRLVTRDPTRARELVEALPDTTVLVHDVTDPEFLERENIGDADVGVVALDSDQEGLLTSMLVRKRGIDRTITVVDTAKYDELFEAAGVDVAVHPRAEAAEAIARFTRARRAENVAIVERDVAEVFEVEIQPDSLAIDHTVNELEEHLPDSAVVAAIVREDDYLVARPSINIQEGDHVVVFTAADVSDEVLTRL